MKPVGIQRSRKKGARLTSPNGLPVFCVTRPGEFGNPFKVGQWVYWPDPGESGDFSGMLYVITTVEFTRLGFTEIKTAAQAVEHFRKLVERSKWLRDRLYHLRGKNLACYCKIGDPCHRDVLLELANA